LNPISFYLIENKSTQEINTGRPNVAVVMRAPAKIIKGR
tara:strand:- start:403 stop:519 length:117 start_codon:yes stop_codon:yes gene_type:complete